jgi:hypothetical protein
MTYSLLSTLLSLLVLLPILCCFIRPSPGPYNLNGFEWILRHNPPKLDIALENMSQEAKLVLTPPTLPIPSKCEMPPPPLPSPKHAASNSIASSRAAATSLNRLSLQSPVKTTKDICEFDVPRHRSSTLVSSPITVSRSNSPERRKSQAQEPTNFLVALAAQERRVLELKEELEKAEQDLDKLKKQWAAHEANKKRYEMRHAAEPMRPLASPVITSESESEREREGRPNRDEDRGDVSRCIPAKSHQRRVFAGGRHTRTLSLLSPPSTINRQDPTSINQNLKKPIAQRDGHISSESPASPDGAIFETPLSFKKVAGKGTKDDIVNTGKQFVGDLKEGLWGFIEDLRQATVGDEAVSGPKPGQDPMRRFSPARHSVSYIARTPDRKVPLPRQQSTVGSSLGSYSYPIKDETAAEADVSKNIQESPKSDTAENSFLDEGWDNWDSPPAKSSSPTASTSARTVESSPRTSTR